jgi:hypothetical protein
MFTKVEDRILLLSMNQRESFVRLFGLPVIINKGKLCHTIVVANVSQHPFFRIYILIRKINTLFLVPIIPGKAGIQRYYWMPDHVRHDDVYLFNCHFNKKIEMDGAP